MNADSKPPASRPVRTDTATKNNSIKNERLAKALKDNLQRRKRAPRTT